MQRVTIVFDDGSVRVATFTDERNARSCFNLACEDADTAFAIWIDSDDNQVNKYCKGATFA